VDLNYFHENLFVKKMNLKNRLKVESKQNENTMRKKGVLQLALQLNF
jgi:hypothetical protein